MKFTVSDIGSFKMISIEGDLLINKRYQDINKRLLELIKEGFHHFVFNLEKLSLIDSSGISVFINCLCDVQENSGSIFLVIPDENVKEVIELVGLNRLIKVYESMEDFTKEQVEN